MNYHYISLEYYNRKTWMVVLIDASYGVLKCVILQTALRLKNVVVIHLGNDAKDF